MHTQERVQLRIVKSEQVRPHEIADPKREKRIEQRLRADEVLRDPLMVGSVPHTAGYVLLDGTNRQRALRALGLPRALVQVIDYADQHAVQLRSWCHAVPGRLDELLTGASTISGLEPAPLPPLAASESLESTDTIAVLLNRNERFALTRKAGSTSRTEQLRMLVNLYEKDMVRIDCDPDAVEERIQTLTPEGGEESILIAYPRFSRSQVVAMAMGGHLIPAGITRHVILCGRALRVNVPLTYLGQEVSERETEDRLQEHLASLHPRLYSEPTVLFDS